MNEKKVLVVIDMQNDFIDGDSRKDISEIDNLPCGNYKCPFEYTPCASACSDCSDNQCSGMGDRCYNCSNKNCIVSINR